MPVWWKARERKSKGGKGGGGGGLHQWGEGMLRFVLWMLYRSLVSAHLLSLSLSYTRKLAPRVEPRCLWVPSLRLAWQIKKKNKKMYKCKVSSDCLQPLLVRLSLRGFLPCADSSRGARSDIRLLPQFVRGFRWERPSNCIDKYVE